MNDLTLLIPAKKEAQCLPVVLNSISHLACKKYVIIEKNGNQTAGTTTDFDGNYTIKPIEPGNYTIKATFVGYGTVEITVVIISANKITFQDVK